MSDLSNIDLSTIEKLAKYFDENPPPAGGSPFGRAMMIHLAQWEKKVEERIGKLEKAIGVIADHLLNDDEKKPTGAATSASAEVEEEAEDENEIPKPDVVSHTVTVKSGTKVQAPPAAPISSPPPAEAPPAPPSNGAKS